MTNPDRPPARAADFYTLLTARAKEETAFYGHCDRCCGETRHVLIGETTIQEIYACGGCGKEKAYTVR
jgi:hypothetical protein